MLRWVLQQNVIAIPKSENPQRIQENGDIYGFSLDGDDLESISALDQGQDGNIGMWNPWDYN